MPTIQGRDLFEHAISSGFYDAFFGSPSKTTFTGNDRYRRKNDGLLIVSTGSAVGVRRNITGTPTFGYMSFALQIDGFAAGDITIASFGVTGGVVVPALYLGASGLYAAIGADFGAEYALASDKWYWVEAICDVGGTTQTMAFRVWEDGLSEDGEAAVITGGTPTTVLWSQFASLAGNPSGHSSWRSWWKYGSATSLTDWLDEPFEETVDDFDGAGTLESAYWDSAMSAYSVPTASGGVLDWPQFPSARYKETIGPDQGVQVKFTGGADAIYLVLRLTDPNSGSEDGYVVNANKDGLGPAEAWRMVGGAGGMTSLGFANGIVQPTDDWVRATVVGDTIRLYGSSDGVTWNLRQTWTDSAITGSGETAIWHANNVWPGSLDNYGVLDLNVAVEDVTHVIIPPQFF